MGVHRNHVLMFPPSFFYDEYFIVGLQLCCQEIRETPPSLHGQTTRHHTAATHGLFVIMSSRIALGHRDREDLELPKEYLMKELPGSEPVP